MQSVVRHLRTKLWTNHRSFSHLIRSSDKPLFRGTSVRWASSPAQAAGHVNLAAAEANHLARIELAAAYRILERLDFHEGICNHLTLMAPAKDGQGEVMLLVPYGLHWKEVTASSLLGLDREGKVVEGEGEPEVTAFHIHQGVRDVTPHKCVLHIHAPYMTALGCLKDPTILPLHQTYLRFDGKIAYDTEFGGVVEEMDEAHRLGQKLADKDVLMMCNHGAMAVGDSVHFAFDSLYYLERLCQTQILAMSTGKEIQLMEEKAYRMSEGYYKDVTQRCAEKHFNSWLRVLYKESPEFAT